VKKLKKLHIKERIRTFRHWQQQPHQVDPMSEEHHVCHTCETEYQGNFCPRCGQSARIGRYSFKSAFLSFLDVWGLGNRGMFRTLRDLLLRPGYMIRDYIQGMQMAYFPPFKMFFLLATLSLFVANGLNIKGYHSGRIADEEAALEKLRHDQQNVGQEEGVDTYTYAIYEAVGNVADGVFRLASWSPALFAFSWLLLMSIFLYQFFHYCPNIPDLRYSEFVVACVYITNMYTIFSIVCDFFCVQSIGWLALVLILIPFKQLSGYSWKRMFFYLLIAFVSLIVLILVVLADLVVIVGWIYNKVPVATCILLLSISALVLLALYLFIRWITRINKERFERYQERLRKVRTTIRGELPKRKGKVPPIPSEM
jgi:hypothetical protein